jgi:soluble lytic murein transglycosylase-like protein
LAAIQHCQLAQVTNNYDPALLMAAIITPESSGDPNAIGKAYDTGLAQVVPNEHPNPQFRNRPSQAQLLEPQFNLNYAACLLRDNIKRTGTIRAGLSAVNGSATYPDVILAHYARFTESVKIL